MTLDNGMYVVNVAKKLRMESITMITTMERIMTNYGKIKIKERNEVYVPNNQPQRNRNHSPPNHGQARDYSERHKRILKHIRA